MMRKSIIAALTLAAVLTGVFWIWTLTHPGGVLLGPVRAPHRPDWAVILVYEGGGVQLWGFRGLTGKHYEDLRPFFCSALTEGLLPGPKATLWCKLRVGTYRVEESVFVIAVPAWVPSLLFGLYPAIAFFRGPMRRYRRRKRGLCIHCRYDLTGNVSGVCPECGGMVSDRRDRDSGAYDDLPH